MKYEGWENRETWAAWRWVSNEERLYRNARAILEHNRTPKEVARSLERLFAGLKERKRLLAMMDGWDEEQIDAMLNDIGELDLVAWPQIVTNLKRALA